jgi:hypothetical protein
MPRRMSKAREDEWLELTEFFAFWVTYIKPKLTPRLPPSQALKALVAIEAKYGRSKALQGLKQAVGDILEMTSAFHGEPLRLLDDILRSRGLVTLTALHRRQSSKYKSILRRGRVRDETEYYLLSAIANDMTLDLPKQERQTLDRLLHTFEQGAV